MSYNIDTWETKELENFAIPFAAISDHEDMTAKTDKDNNVTVGGFVGYFLIEGKLHKDKVIVSDICYMYDGSGWEWDNFKEWLKQSSGKMVATQVWEGGDSITRLTVIDGEVSEEEIEI